MRKAAFWGAAFLLLKNVLDFLSEGCLLHPQDSLGCDHTLLPLQGAKRRPRRIAEAHFERVAELVQVPSSTFQGDRFREP